MVRFFIDRPIFAWVLAIIVMLGALIPVSDTIRTTGAADLIAGWLSQAAMLLPPAGAYAAMGPAIGLSLSFRRAGLLAPR